jgi:hypothetical protein
MLETVAMPDEVNVRFRSQKRLARFGALLGSSFHEFSGRKDFLKEMAN